MAIIKLIWKKMNIAKRSSIWQPLNKNTFSPFSFLKSLQFRGVNIRKEEFPK
jgi:hypothetical protein